MKIVGKPSVSAVTSHVYRAMRRLKSLLEQSGYFAEMKFPAASIPKRRPELVEGLHPVRYRGKSYGACREGAYHVLAWQEGESPSPW